MNKLFLLLLGQSLVIFAIAQSPNRLAENDVLEASCIPRVFELPAQRVGLVSCSTDGVEYMVVIDVNTGAVQQLDPTASARFLGVVSQTDFATNSHFVFAPTFSDGNDSTRTVLAQLDAESLAPIRIDTLGPKRASFGRGTDFSFNSVSVKTPTELHRASVLRRIASGSYGIDIFSYSYEADSVAYFTVPVGELRSSAFAIAASQTEFYMLSNNEFLTVYKRSGDVERFYDLLVQDDHDLNNPALGGTLFTGLYSNPSIAYFDSSLYIWATTSLPSAEPRTAMHIQQLDPVTFELLGRAVTDTAAFDNPALVPAGLNRATSITPDGSRLFLAAWGANEARDTMTWHIHSFDKDFAEYHDIDFKLPATGGWAGNLWGVEALSDGSALIYGAQSDVIQLYRVPADSNGVAALGEIPFPSRDSRSDLSMVYPNPVGTNGLLSLNRNQLPTATEQLEVLDVSGSLLQVFDRSALSAEQLRLTSLASVGSYFLLARDRAGKVLGQQRLIRVE